MSFREFERVFGGSMFHVSAQDSGIREQMVETTIEETLAAKKSENALQHALAFAQSLQVFDIMKRHYHATFIAAEPFSDEQCRFPCVVVALFPDLWLWFSWQLGGDYERLPRDCFAAQNGCGMCLKHSRNKTSKRKIVAVVKLVRPTDGHVFERYVAHTDTAKPDINKSAIDRFCSEAMRLFLFQHIVKI